MSDEDSIVSQASPHSHKDEEPDFFCLRNRAFGTGEILDSSGKIVWQYSPPQSARNLGISFFKRPDFLLVDSAGKELLRITQTKRFPLRTFAMTAGDSPLARIEERSALTTHYVAQFVGGDQWTLRKPLFSVNFMYLCEDLKSIRVHIFKEVIWYVHRGDTLDNLQLIATVAFVHSEHCRT